MPTKKAEQAGCAKLTQTAYEKIKKAIISSKFKPGVPISGSQLAKNLNMSRTPIREAIQILASEDLVEMKHGVGFYVKNITLKEFQNLIEVRIALEKLAIQSAIRILPKDTLNDLLEQWKSHVQKIKAGETGDFSAIAELDRHTHHVINQACGNDYLFGLLHSIENRVVHMHYFTVNAISPSTTIEMHILILEAMLKGDLALTQDILERHIINGAEHMTKLLAFWSANPGALTGEDFYREISQDEANPRD